LLTFSFGEYGGVPAASTRPSRSASPDAGGRRALFALYLGQPVDDSTIDDAVALARTAGVAAAFVKELARRATSHAIRSGDDLAVALRTALDDIVETATPLLRASLAAPTRR
jgi:hypothetical protein